ncbi:MAG TPA: pseudouridine-5'-phosphate glycosidase [Candidatus Didemnitutus sp.]|nr:pseudouridine-5'-phosphate glycosidase [Candidatus Didemnitutus sp.]
MEIEKHVRLSPEVAAALREGRAVVALESTLITHGLPWPANFETASSMEEAVRAGGAVPATIAVLGGVITAGISRVEMEALAKRPVGSVRKCSRRDLPIAVARREDAATTVAGTMIVAAAAGISVFATGGIGGVHRGAPFDVSADLLELGRTPVAVVCSGAKSILDLPLTLEVLETQGVPVVGYQTDTLPSFYSRSSGLPVDVRVDDAASAASIYIASRELGSEHGVLITVPVPAADAMPAEEAERAIVQATREADEQGVHGKALTPFLLKRVAEITGGASRRANTSLLVNNARTAAAIAIEVVRRLQRKK